MHHYKSLLTYDLYDQCIVTGSFTPVCQVALATDHDDEVASWCTCLASSTIYVNTEATYLDITETYLFTCYLSS